jgi:hypothetical protein
MASKHPTDPIRGRTIRFSWSDGPTKGSVHEHIFHDDETVEWRSVEQRSAGNERAGKGEAGSAHKPERPRYFSVELTDDFWLVSYLSQSGFTLTVVLNFEDASMVGIASNDKMWTPVRGHFEVTA